MLCWRGVVANTAVFYGYSQAPGITSPLAKAARITVGFDRGGILCAVGDGVGSEGCQLRRAHAIGNRRRGFIPGTWISYLLVRWVLTHFD